MRYRDLQLFRQRAQLLGWTVRRAVEAAARRLVAARARGGFADVQSLATRAALDRRELGCLAAAGALALFEAARRTKP